MDISVNAAEVARELNAIAERVPRATQAGLRAIANDGRTHVQQQIARIYKRRIPTRGEVSAYRGKGKRRRQTPGSSKPAWKRSGKLQSGVRMVVGQSTAKISIQGDAAKPITNWPGGYAQRRAALGVTWTPKQPALGVVRTNNFMEDAATRMEPKAPEIFRQAFENELKAGS
jgi:hypothetical protein